MNITDIKIEELKEKIKKREGVLEAYTKQNRNPKKVAARTAELEGWRVKLVELQPKPEPKKDEPKK